MVLQVSVTPLLVRACLPLSDFLQKDPADLTGRDDDPVFFVGFEFFFVAVLAGAFFVVFEGA